MWGIKVQVLVLLLLAFAGAASAGWNDMVFRSSENLQDFHQGRPISLSVLVNNTEDDDGNAVYILNITLNVPECVNNGVPITVDGVIICPTTDSSCKNRFRNAGTSATFNFTNIPTNASCRNGLHAYNFTFKGNVELLGSESKWSTTLRETNTTPYFFRFIGADVCGDSLCANVENCTTCPNDCGRCPECASGARTCLNNSIYACVGGFFTSRIETCEHGCEVVNGTPQCRRLCTEGAKMCADDGRTLQTCTNNAWVNQTCIRGCVDNACETNLCQGIVCPDKCENGTAQSYGFCEPSTGNCTYMTVQNCSNGCTGTVCAAGTPTPMPTATPAPKQNACCGIALVLLLGFGLTRLV